MLSGTWAFPFSETKMKTIGLIGGMSWESSLVYYRLINEDVRARLGSLHSAKCLMYSVDFAEIEPLQHRGRWSEAAERMIEVARHLEDGGADFLLLCTNTMHKTADEIDKHVQIPLLHIGDATAEAVKRQRINKVGLLGTKFTMEDDFYRAHLIEKHGLEAIIPKEKERQTIHRVIYDELCLGKIERRSKEQYKNIIENLVGRGANGIVLGCTEIGLLVGNEDSEVTVFDTTQIHAEAAVNHALDG
jgi:amino-acid racemase